MPKEPPVRTRMSRSLFTDDSSQKHLRLIFDGESSDEEIEMIIPLVLRKSKKKKEVKRAFTTTSNPFPFNLSTVYPSEKDGWTTLTRNVYNWMQQNVRERATDEWRWAVNFFWICYVGSSPGFPFEWGETTVLWNSKVVPMGGEFMSMRSDSRTFEGGIPDETGATLIARLVEWLKLKEKWIREGVGLREFRRVTASE